MYVDESGDSGMLNSPTRYFVLTGLVIHELRWQTNLEQIVSFRGRMREEFGLRVREEIHAAAMINKPGSLARIRRNVRLTIIRAFANELATMKDLNIINVVVDKQGKAADYFDPTRRNIELVADLRDEATHLVISQIPNDVLALLQACVLNYHARLGEWWGVSLSERVPVGMMTLVYDLSPDQLDLGSAVLRRRLGSDAAKYLIGFQDEIRREHLNLGGSTQFSIGIDYSLVLTNKPKDADISLTVGPDGQPLSKIEVPKDPAKTHPYRQKELIKQVNEALSEEATINQYDVQCVRKVHNIEKRSEFHYQSGVKGSPKQYSHGLVEWMVKRYRQDNEFFQKARQKASDLRI